MRPLELVIEGFRSYGERTIFDFRDRHLVGIVGPIGSGKSSILDAVVFALYGKTPVFERENKTLIKQGWEQARVELTFEVDGREWRAVRVLRARGPSQHALLRCGDGAQGLRVETEKQKEVDERIEQLLGLDFRAFCRSVLLAQNRFNEFLNASPGDRDKVLKGVFGFDRLDNMHTLARERRDTAGLEVRGAEERLASLAGDRERLTATQAALAASTARAERLEAAEERVRELARTTEEARQRHGQAAATLARLEKLAAQLPDGEETTAAVDAVAAATAAVDAAEERCRSAREECAAAEAEQEAVVEEVGSAAELARAEAAIAGLVRAEETLTRRERARQDAEAAVDRARADLAEVQKARRDAEEAAAQAAEGERLAATALAEARGALAAVAAEVGDRAALDRGRERLGDLRHARKQAERDRSAAGEAAQREAEAAEGLTAAQERQRAAASAEAQAKQAAAAAAADLAAAEEALHRAERAEMAAILHHSLAPGEPCPVCDRVVEEVPARAEPAEVEAARARLEEQREAQQRAEEMLRLAASTVAVRGEAVAGAKRALQGASEQRRAAEEQLAASEKGCQAILEELAELLGGGEEQDDLEARWAAADARLRRSVEAVGEREAEHRQQETTAKDASHALAVARQREDGARQGESAALQGLAAAEAEHTAAVGARDETRSELAQLLGDGDPATLLAAARGRLRAAEERSEAARAAERAAGEAREQARQRRDEARHAQERLEIRLTGFAGQLDFLAGAEADAMSLGELAAEVAARLAAARDGAESERYAATVAERTADAARERLWGELGVAAEVGAGATYERLLAGARSDRDRDATLVAELEQRLGKAAELEAGLAAARARYKLYEELCRDLNADRFLRYLLDEERAALADLGSERFEMLSGGRYRFTADGSFEIVDLANAEAVRRADTLSGGETFLASLALALALAEKVTGSGGRLDAFFLDEGFGSLDREHLDLALEGVERLVTDSPRRLVTIVSHVPDLRERVEDLIVLDKHPLTGDTIVRSGARRS